MTLLLLMLFLSTFCLTALCRHYALVRNIMDIPNHRSSHTAPTPRGGGIAFVIVFTLYLLWLGYQGAIATGVALAFCGSGLWVAGIGFIDDHFRVSAAWRLLGHFMASAFALFCLGGLPLVISLGMNLTVASVLINIFALFYLVWLLNLYNFMDGIDGIAAIEGITVCLGGSLLYLLQGYTSYIMLPLVLAVVLTAFLCWNFPRARIFMGDAGSGFLGLVIGLLSIQAASVNVAFFWSWLILSGVFIVDATVTLIRRVYQGKRFDEAHRSHAYQTAADCFQNHAVVTLGVLVINLIWLLPLALLVGGGYIHGVAGLMLAYIPLAILVFQFHAGSA